jgi:hypothetical protein
MDQRFDELLPFYVNGTLQGEDRAWVERQLADNADARAELEWLASLRTRIADSAPKVPATIGLDKVMMRIRGPQPTFAERLRGFFDLIGARPVTAFAGLAIITLQAGAILALMQPPRDDADGLRATRATAVKEGPMLKINFAPDAKEAEIRHLLMSVQGRLAGGPGQLGDYYVVVPAGREAAIAAQVKASPIVQAVAVAPGLPPGE